MFNLNIYILSRRNATRMLFSHDNNVVTTLFSHHYYNNLLTSWNSRVSEHGCCLNTTAFEQPWYFIIAEQNCWNNAKQYCWSKMLLTHDNNGSSSVVHATTPHVKNLWDFTLGFYLCTTDLYINGLVIRLQNWSDRKWRIWSNKISNL